MTGTYKVCPICQARNRHNAALCETCGATTADVGLKRDSDEVDAGGEVYDYRYGETDLAESALAFRGRAGGVLLAALVVVIMAIVAGLALEPRLRERAAAMPRATDTSQPTRQGGPSITPGTPTATFTASPPPTAAPTLKPTQGPCRHQVAQGDSLISIVARCGHNNLVILPTVMALNRIADETQIQIGQEVIVPRPSPTVDPARADAPGDSASAAEEASQLERLAFDPFAPTLTPTLLPGLMWHIVQANEDMIYIAAVYDTNAKTLSDLNPEIAFPLCDFSEVYGGPECTVQLSVNQQVRVPAPTATMTSMPTASGKETATPRPTATFNAPIAQSPADEAYFSPVDQVTLRWVATGRLEADEVYRLDLANLDSGERYQADTRELFLIVPAEWQSRDAESQRYSWQVRVWDTVSNTSAYMTEPRTFTWQGKGQAEL